MQCRNTCMPCNCKHASSESIDLHTQHSDDFAGLFLQVRSYRSSPVVQSSGPVQRIVTPIWPDKILDRGRRCEYRTNWSDHPLKSKATLRRPFTRVTGAVIVVCYGYNTNSRIILRRTTFSYVVRALFTDVYSAPP